MADLNLSRATTTEISVPDFIVEAKALDTENTQGETFWYFPEATTNFGYYFSIPEINSSANSLATWTTGKGIDFQGNTMTEVDMERIIGIGNDSFQTILWNHEVTKLVVGDAFIEIVKKDTKIINLKPISPERVRIVVSGGLIKRYDVWDSKKWVKIMPEKMIHSSNNRIGDQIHGTSQIDACKWVIDARNEALITNRMIEKRGRALGIVYYKTNNTGKISYANEQIEKAVKNGQMLGLPEDTAEIKDFPVKSLQERLNWIRYLENFFYQTFGVPRIIATSEGTSEVGGKIGFLVFEPIYTRQQSLLEEDFWHQAGIKFKFLRPPTLSGVVAQDEAKNTGQLGIQPNDMEASMTRE